MFLILLSLLAAATHLQGAATVSEVRAAQIPGTHQVRITYNLVAASACTVSVQVWIDGSGAGLDVPATAFSGDCYATAVTPGIGKAITLTVAQTAVNGVTTIKAPALQNTFTKNLRFKVLATENSPATYGDLVRIDAGSFQMGDQSNPVVGYTHEKPVHTVYVNEFYMSKYETTKELWDSVRLSPLISGYTDLPTGNGSSASKGVNHPVHSITWYAMVKWCNARSQKEGLTPCYYTDAAQTLIYKTGNINIDNTMVKWSANGYRLPTEAEWEKAARGKLTGKNFPWGDTITHNQANYYSSSSYSYDVSLTRGYHPIWSNNNNGVSPYTAPVDSFAPNGYGLYNMSGNVWERCWDWYSSS